MNSPHRRLGNAVRERRLKLGQTQTEFATNAGFSMKTLQRLELGQQKHDLSPATLGGIDRAAGWKSGSAKAILDGGDPQESEPGEHVDAATIESSALLVWTAQRTGGEEAVERVYARLAAKLNRDELREVTRRVVELESR